MMILNQKYNTTFTSRNRQIRFADDLVRKVNQEFPRVSASKLESFNNAKNFGFLIEDLWGLTSFIRSIINGNFLELEESTEKIKLLLNTIKTRKLGNCQESAQLALVVAKINGIENCKIAHLISPKEYNYDHAVVLVEDEKPYIIDAWLGFADYIPNAIKKYQKDFRNCFDFSKAKTEKMLVKEDFGIIQRFLNYEITSEDIKKTKSIYPNLILTK